MLIVPKEKRLPKRLGLPICAFLAIKISRGGPPLGPIASPSPADGDTGEEGLLGGSSQAIERSPSGDQEGPFPVILPKKS